jgi:hypothetical protein
MKRYETVSGIFFTILSLVQLTRTLFRWPVQIGGVNIPVWCSALAFLIAGSFALWAFRSARAS